MLRISLLYYAVVLMTGLLAFNFANETAKGFDLIGKNWRELINMIVSDSEISPDSGEIDLILNHLVTALDEDPNDVRYDIKTKVKAWLEFGNPAGLHCNPEFFSNLRQYIVYDGSDFRKIGDYLIDAERKQFSLCRDEIANNISTSLSSFDKDTKHEALEFRKCFDEPLPIGDKSVFESATKIAERKSRLVKGLMAYMGSKSQLNRGKRWCFSRIKEREVAKTFEKTVGSLCRKVVEELRFQIDIVDALYDRTLIKTIDRTSLKWIEVYQICYQILSHRHKLIEEIYKELKCQPGR